MSTPCSGILELDPKRFGFLRTPSHDLSREPSDPFISPSLLAQYNLRNGAQVEGTAAQHTGKNPEVDTITRINGLTPAEWRALREFSAHDAVSPNEPIRLEGHDSAVAMRIVDLFCPLGKGQRALIVSPPKAGKTILLQQMAYAISRNNKEIDVIVLLVDERPEEVTEMRRSIQGEVFASSSDTERGDQVRLAQLVLDYARRKAETGRDVALLLDSLTRLGRAFNVHQKSSGRTLSGGVDSRALEIPKRIFGAARKLEEGGSLTIIATALIETNSRMDELIFQEFKGTGNMELVLDRTLANERIFPAINLGLSGTRREELLFGPDTSMHQNIRRMISRLNPRDAMLQVLKMIEQYSTNEVLLGKIGTRG